MNLGMTIKDLRIKKNLTQEQLANYLSVSVQTISRWETSVNYPDVLMIPILANIFDVTTDHLLGVDVLKNKESIDKILQDVQQLLHIGHLDEAINVLRKGIRQFPNDYNLLLTLSSTLNFHNDKNKDYLKESILISEKILETTTDEKFRRNAISNLFFAHLNIGDKKSARQVYDNYVANSITDDFYSHHVLEGDELVNSLQNSILRKYYDLWSILMTIRGLDIYSREEKIKLLDKFNLLTTIFFDNNDLGYYNWLVFSINEKISFLSAELENKEFTLKYLEITSEYAINYDTRPDKIIRSSLLLNKTEDMKKGTTTNGKGNCCYGLLVNMNHKRFDFIREDSTFLKISKRLETYAQEL